MGKENPRRWVVRRSLVFQANHRWFCRMPWTIAQGVVFANNSELIWQQRYKSEEDPSIKNHSKAFKQSMLCSMLWWFYQSWFVFSLSIPNRPDSRFGQDVCESASHSRANRKSHACICDVVLFNGQWSMVYWSLVNGLLFNTISIERNPFPAKNQTLRSYRVYILPTSSTLPALVQIESLWTNDYYSSTKQGSEKTVYSTNRTY